MPIESKTDNHTTIEALLNISLAVQEMNKPADLSKVMQTCLSELHKLNIPADAMAVHQIIDAEQGTLKTHRVWQNKVIDTIEPGRHGLVRRWKEGRTFYEKDLNARGGGYPEAFRKRFEDFHLMSFVDIPFAQGILTLQSLQKQAFPEHIQVLFRDVAILFAIGLVRLEDLETVESQNKALQESEQKVRKLNEELEQRIKTRTKDLQTANQNLQNEIAIRKSAEKDLHQSNMLLEGLQHVQTQYIEKVDTKTLFEELLQDLLNLTQSEYGFIGEVLHTPKNEPYLKTHAITNIAWNDETRAFYEENAPQGLEFVNLKSLFGSVMTTEKPVIANSPATDPRRTGIPEGHPPLDAFLGIPFFSANNIVGMVGIANRKQGYDQPIIDFLAPFLVTCGAIIEAQQNEQRREQAEESLAQSEEKLRQSQKMEAIGKLAGGVAHDFNNLLTVINGYSKILLDVLQTTDPNREFIEEILKAGNRASALTNQLLIFSRRKVIQPEVVDLNQVTTDLQKMWSRLIGENIDLKLRLHARSSFVEADPGQLEQVILNIVINARDAMPQGGSLTIELSNTHITPNQAKQWGDIQPGPYVLFSVHDTGQGISPEIRDQIFEPFFTTKEKGKGTGLGLATVYGIVIQSGGYIDVESEEGKGTTFNTYLPQVEQQNKKTEESSFANETVSGKETILLVEDEYQVRVWVQKVLSKYGYTIIDAPNGTDALGIWQKNSTAFDLLITDVIMPKMSGRELANQLLSDRPDLKVLYMSGYTDDELGPHGILESGIQFIQKPFSPENFLTKIRNLLDI